jgi:hypothetical protein
MSWTNISRYLVALLIGSLLIPLVIVISPVAVQAKPWLPKKGSPSQTVGGGRRDPGICEKDFKQASTNDAGAKATLEQFLVALVPTNGTALTISERPTFFIYVPKTSARTAELILDDETVTDENLKPLITVKIDLKNTPGIFSLTPSSKDKPLEIGKDYDWVFSIVCDSRGALKDPLVAGKIRRVQPDSALLRKLEKAPLLERLSLYRSAGIWYEALQDLATLRLKQPDDVKLAMAWKDLLQSISLDALADFPLKGK